MVESCERNLPSNTAFWNFLWLVLARHILAIRETSLPLIQRALDSVARARTVQSGTFIVQLSGYRSFVILLADCIRRYPKYTTTEHGKALVSTFLCHSIWRALLSHTQHLPDDSPEKRELIGALEELEGITRKYKLEQGVGHPEQAVATSVGGLQTMTTEEPPSVCQLPPLIHYSPTHSHCAKVETKTFGIGLRLERTLKL